MQSVRKGILGTKIRSLRGTKVSRDIIILCVGDISGTLDD